MKKVLTVLGLALIANMAFAQTTVGTSQKEEMFKKQATPKLVKAPAVNYKASIFATKDMGTDVGDTLVFWNFDNTDGILYGDNGKVSGSGNYVRMQNPDSNYAWVRVDMQPHTLSTNANVFMLIPDTNYIRQHSTDYSGFWSIDRLNSYVLNLMKTNFMMIYPAGTTVNQTKRHNAFVKFPVVENPQVGNMYQIRFRQNFEKFYDREYIDFKVGNEWYSREINVDGIDADINSWADGNRSYTMPLEFGMQQDLEFRMRLYNPPTNGTVGIRSNAYGYVWAFDDVAIVRSTSQGWIHAEQRFVDGGYGLLPRNMNVPLAWYGYVYNEGNININDPVATAYHIDPNGDATVLTSKMGDTLLPVAGNTNLLSLNERGFYDSIWSPGWFGYATAWHNYGEPVHEMPSGYTQKGLPSDEIGLHKITVTASATGIDDMEFDTIAYNVVGSTGGDNTNLSVAGYRWGHDNGVIASGSIYRYGYTYDAETDDYYVTEEGNYDQAGYYVTVRYTTPDVVPTDDNGDPWVIRGIEIVPQTVDTTIRGSVISPLLMRMVYFDSVDEQGNPTQYSYVERLGSEVTGISNEYTYEVTDDDVNMEINEAQSGYIPYGQAYRAVNIRTPGQPELEPNTALHVGYIMEQAGYFAAAVQQNAYRNASGSAVGFYDNEDLADYYYQFQPYLWDVRVKDPIYDRVLHTGTLFPYWPMIRLIVGPRQEIPSFTIEAICPDTNEVIILNDRYENMCGETTIGYQYGDATVIVLGQGDSSWLHPGIVDTIYIDNHAISIEDEDSFFGNGYTITEALEALRNASGEVLMQRPYYIVTFDNLNANHQVKAVGHAYPYNLGIEGEAVSVSLGMRPNPASHNVTLNMTGVTGMVNCSIIDMSGRVVYNRTIDAETSHTIDLSNVAAGAYFVRVTNNSFSKVEKLIVR